MRRAIQIVIARPAASSSDAASAHSHIDLRIGASPASSGSETTAVQPETGDRVKACSTTVPSCGWPRPNASALCCIASRSDIDTGLPMNRSGWSAWAIIKPRPSTRLALPSGTLFWLSTRRWKDSTGRTRLAQYRTAPSRTTGTSILTTGRFATAPMNTSE